MDYFSLIFNCGVPIVLLVIALVAGTVIERRHFSKLKQREGEIRGLPTMNLKRPPRHVPTGGSILVMGSVVIASDYLKTTLAKLRNIFGGNVRSFERLMERARREALLRLMDEARAVNAVGVINVRYETSSIGAMSKNPAPMVEVICYGTALLRPGAMAADSMRFEFNCPKCEYNLTHAPMLGCPECGWKR